LYANDKLALQTFVQVLSLMLLKPSLNKLELDRRSTMDGKQKLRLACVCHSCAPGHDTRKEDLWSTSQMNNLPMTPALTATSSLRAWWRYLKLNYY